MTLTIAGLSGFGRSSAALVQDGAVRAAAAEELFSRRKNDPALPVQAFAWACRQAGVEPAAVELIAFAEKPVQRFVRILGGLAQGFPFTLRRFPHTLTTWLGDRIWLKHALMKALAVHPDRLLFVERPVAQAAAAFFGSAFDEAAILVVDGAAEWAATTLARGKGTSLEVLAEIQHPHSLPFFLDAVAHHLLVPESGGLRWLAPLAAYGEPRLAAAMRDLVREEPDGAYSLDPGAFDLSGGTAKFTAKARRLLGEARGAGQDATRWADVVNSAQVVVEERVLALCREAKRRAGGTRLCVSGAVFQHPGIAARVLRDAPFDEVHVDPYLDEAAAAVGAALYVSHAVQGVPRTRPHSAVRECALPEVPESAAWTATVKHRDDLAASAVAALSDGGSVALVAGRPELETRPRGLRALLVDPSRPDAVQKLRVQIKLAEPYVPLALCGLQDVVAAWHAPRTRAAAERCQATVTIANGQVEALRGGVHVDRTALVHAVDPGAQPLLAAVLRQHAVRTGRPAVLAMSSLNRAGDPTVMAPLEAVDLLRRSDIALLIWGDQEVRPR